jgi:hypothetical protein
MILVGVGIEKLQELLTLHLRMYRWPCSRVSRGKVRRLTVWGRVLVGARQTIRQSCDGWQYVRWRRLLRLIVFVFLLVGHVVRVCQENVVWQVRAQRRSVQVKRMVFTSDSYEGWSSRAAGKKKNNENQNLLLCSGAWVTCLR